MVGKFSEFYALSTVQAVLFPVTFSCKTPLSDTDLSCSFAALTKDHLMEFIHGTDRTLFQKILSHGVSMFCLT